MSGPDPTALVRRGASVPTSPVVSVCVLVLSDAALAIDCIDSLAGASRLHEVETVVVANGTPVPARRVLEQREDIVLVRSGTNLGFAGGNNLAAEVARGRYLLFLNDDSTVEEGYIDRLLATLASDGSIGAVGGRILSSDGSLQEAGSVLWSDGSANHVGIGLPPGTAEFNYVRDVDYVSANGLLVRRTAWEDVGGFDERYFPAYYEDVDLCLALRRHGHRIVYEPRARMFHLENQSTSLRYRKFLLVRNRLRFVDKWSVELADHDDRPRRDDAASLEHAIHRARGAPPRLLVVADGADPRKSAELWDIVEALAAQGWAITVASAVADPSARTDRLVELGVDVRSGAVTEVLATTGPEFEGLVVGATSTYPSVPIVRGDGTEVPSIRIPHRSDDVTSTVLAIAAQARRMPGPAGVRRQVPSDPPPTDGEVAGSSDGTASERNVQLLRELRFAKADIEVRNEYIASLEARPVQTVAFLRAKAATAGSLVGNWLKVRMRGTRRTPNP